MLSPAIVTASANCYVFDFLCKALHIIPTLSDSSVCRQLNLDLHNHPLIGASL
jgi:hypothetical protein